MDFEANYGYPHRPDSSVFGWVEVEVEVELLEIVLLLWCREMAEKGLKQGDNDLLRIESRKKNNRFIPKNLCIIKLRYNNDGNSTYMYPNT